MRTNRAMDLLGIPDLPGRAFVKEGGQIKPQGGSGGGAPTQQTITQTNIPEYARPYAETMLGQAEALTMAGRGYQPFMDQRFAGFSPMQVDAFQRVAGQQVAPQLTDASNLAFTAAQQGLGMQPMAGALQQTALGYGQAGAGFGGAASTLGLTGAQQAAMDAQRAQDAASMYGGMGASAGQMGMGFGQMGADFGALGAHQAGQIAAGAGSQAGQFGQLGTQFGTAGAQQAAIDAQRAQDAARMFGGMGAGFGGMGADVAAQAQRAAEAQADLYGQMGAGFGAAGAGLAPEAQQMGRTAADLGMAGMGFGAAGADIGGRGVTAAEQGFGAGAQYAQQATSPEAMQDYMSPYMQNVVERQQQEAIRQSNIARQAEQARAVGQGAFGGSRSAIVEAEMQRNLGTQLGDIQAQGLQRAFEQAQQAQQFGAGLGLQGLQTGLQGLQTGMAGTAQGMQGAQTGIAGQQAGLAGLGQAGDLLGMGMAGAGLGLQGTGQRLAAGQLGLAGTAQGIAGAGMGLTGVGQQIAGGQLGLEGARTGMAGAGMGLEGVGQQLAAGQLGLAGTGQGIAGAEAGMRGAQTGISGAGMGLTGVGQQIAGGQLGLAGTQTGIAGQEAGMRGAQTGLSGVGQAVGAGQLGLAGGQLGLSGAGTLGALGGTQFDQQMAIADAQQKYGALMQQQQQQALDFNYQQFLAQQQHPYQQLSFMSDLLRGVPSSQSAQFTTMPQPALAPQLIGAGLGAYGAFGRKEGGRIKKYREGGQVQSYQEGGNVSPMAMQTLNVGEMPSRLRRLSDSQLAAYARTVKDAISLSAIQTELERRSRARMPQGEPPEVTTAEGIAQRAEAAGIGQPRVSMAGGGIVALQAGGPPESFIDRLRNRLFPQPTGAVPTDEELQQRMGIMNPYASQTAPQPAPEVAGPVSGSVTGPDGQPVSAPPQQFPPGTRDLRAPVVIGPQGLPIAVDEQGNELLASPEAPTAPQAAAAQGAPSGIMGVSAAGRSPLGMTFEQFREMGSQVQPNPEDQAVLADMQQRVQERMARADDQSDTAKFDAILMAGLAMMGGTSLADGIARAAQTGGATYMASRQEARKALDAAENAELAFNQYQIELRKGDEKAARDEFNNYMTQTLKLYDIDTKREVGMARAGAERESVLWNRYSQAVARDRRIIEAQREIDNAVTPEKRAEAQNRFNSILSTVEQEYMRRFGLSDPAASSSGARIRYDAQGNLIQ